MKLAQILANYLESNKKLSLPHLGTFTYNNGNIEYNQESVKDFDGTVIDYIVENTGKMKVLAVSDISSQWDDVLQFLNTGKPYTLTGIGTLIKNQKGSYDFQQESNEVSEKKQQKKLTENNKIPQAYIDTDNIKPASRNKGAIVLIVLTIIAIAAIIWFYNNYEKENKKTIAVETPTNTIDQANSKRTDTVETTTTVTAPPTTTQVEQKANNSIQSNDYTFVLEDVIEPRASKRFKQLKNFGWVVELTTADSVHYKIIMKLPKAGMDTTRIKDSLSVQYGKRVYIQP